MKTSTAVLGTRGYEVRTATGPNSPKTRLGAPRYTACNERLSASLSGRTSSGHRGRAWAALATGTGHPDKVIDLSHLRQKKVSIDQDSGFDIGLGVNFGRRCRWDIRS